MSVTVLIVNTYEDGYESSSLAIVDEPESMERDDLETWWEDEVYPKTGDGHGMDNPKLGVLYEAKVIDAADPKLRGQTMEWS